MNYSKEATQSIEDMVQKNHPHSAQLRWLKLKPAEAPPKGWKSTAAAWRADAKLSARNFSQRTGLTVTLSEAAIRKAHSSALVEFRTHLATLARKKIAERKLAEIEERVAEFAI